MKKHLILGIILGALSIPALAWATTYISVPAAPSQGFLLQSTSTGAYNYASLTAGSNITLSTTTNNITISSTGGGGGGGLGWASTTVPDTNSIYSLQAANVGISTTSPYAKLSVSANSFDTYNPTLFVIASSTGGTSTITPLAVYANGTTIINGAIMGGLTSPYSPLEVIGNWTGVSNAYNTNSTFTSYGDVSRFVIRSSQGTQSSPTQILNGGGIGAIQFRGMTSSGNWANSGNAAQITAIAKENFTSTAQGTQFQFRTTPIGTVTPNINMVVDSTGYVGIGTTTPQRHLTIRNNDGLSQIMLEDDGATADHKLGGMKFATGDMSFGDMTDALAYTPILTLASTTATGGGTTTMAYDASVQGTAVIPSLYTGGLSFDTNAGLVNAMDLPVDTTPTVGTPEGYSFTIGGVATSSLNLYGLHSGSGGSIYNFGLGVGSTTPAAKLSVDGVMNETRPVVLVSTTSPSYATTTVLSVDSNGMFLANTVYGQLVEYTAGLTTGSTITATNQGQFYKWTGASTATSTVSGSPYLTYTINGGTESSMTVGTSGGGVYQIGLSVALQVSTSNNIIHCAVFQNELILGSVTGETKLINSGDEQDISAGPGFVKAVSGDKFSVRCSDETAAGQTITFNHVNFGINRISGI